MSVRIPEINTNRLFSRRNIVKQMASDGFLPVIALEAFVEAGRTYQAYQRGGFDEARERITEEFSGAVFWLGGVTALNWLFEKAGQKLLKLPAKTVDIASDSVRKPLANYLEHETTKTGSKILESTMAKFKFVKVISSVLIANAFIGFVLPKINQAITRSYHKHKSNDTQDKNNNSVQNSASIIPAAVNSVQNQFNPRPDFDSFVSPNSKNNDNKNKKDVSFGLNLLSIANKFESDRNYKLLSVDAGTASGRAYSARNNDERIEILFRDLSSIYFYMFNMVNLNNWLNRIEQKGTSSRLDPVSADFATKYMVNYLDDKKGNVSVEQFKADMFGKQANIPDVLKDKFEGKNIKVISLEEFKAGLKTSIPESKLAALEECAEKMSALQPKVKGIAILTEGQAKDILSGGHINNPEFLQKFFANRFGNTKFTDEYKYVAQNELDSIKKQLVDYVNSIVKSAENTDAKEITKELLQKASGKNLKMNAFNWGLGFVTSALFLSTIIPKLQYQITKWRTGSNQFPGTAQYRNEEEKTRTK